MQNLPGGIRPSTRTTRAARSRRALLATAGPTTLLLMALLGACGQASAPATPSASATPSATRPTPTDVATPSATPVVPAPPAPAPTPAPTHQASPSARPTAALPSTGVTITSDGWNASTAAIEVSAYADGVHSGATCTLVLTGPGGATAQVSVAAQPDASTTSCGLMAVPRDHLTAGTWNGQVQYLSSQASGRAVFGPIEIP